LVENHKVSQRRACGTLGINRTAHRYTPKLLPEDEEVERRVIDFACRYGRYGYRMVTDMYNNEAEREGKKRINHKRVYGIWRRNGLKRPEKQPKKARIWQNDGSCIRLRPEKRPNHVWSYDFIEDRTVNGRKIRWLNIYDEGRHICIASIPKRSWKNSAVIEALANAMLIHGTPEYLRSDNGPEFTAKRVISWLGTAGVITTFIEPGSPWENGYVESFNARMRDEFLNGELFGNMYEAEVLTQRWVKEYNEIRPHSSLKGRAPQSIIYAAA